MVRSCYYGLTKSSELNKMTPIQTAVITLILAIVADILSTFFSAKANGLTNPYLQLLAGILYMSSFALCAYSLKHIQAGILYVLWSGLGAVGTTLLSKYFLGQEIDTHGWVGIVIICVGVGYIAQFSNLDV